MRGTTESSIVLRLLTLIHPPKCQWQSTLLLCSTLFRNVPTVAVRIRMARSFSRLYRTEQGLLVPEQRFQFHHLHLIV